jgi:hypothetical protein
MADGLNRKMKSVISKNTTENENRARRLITIETVIDKVVKESKMIGTAHKNKLNEFVKAIRHLAGEKDRMSR